MICHYVAPRIVCAEIIRIVPKIKPGEIRLYFMIFINQRNLLDSKAKKC